MTQDPAYAKRWRLDRHRGIDRLVPAEPVRVHVETLLLQRMSKRSIATAAGVSATTVVRLLDRRHDRLQRRSAQRLLAVTGPADVLAAAGPEAETFVPMWMARRRIEALLALGWRHEDLTARCGFSTATVLHQPTSGWVTARRFRRIAAVYDELHMTLGPSERTRQRVARYDYVPPLAWGDIDDPYEVPSLDARGDDEDAA